MPHPNGLLAWADVALPDLEKGAAFYKAVFGWETQEVPGSEGTYVFFTKGGRKAAGMGLLSAEDAANGVPPVWSNYVTVDDVDSVAARAPELGGTVMLPPMDVLEEGRMAFVIDPTGAVLGFWQGAAHEGADAFNEPGFMSWNELATNDVEAAVAFYTELLGWGADAQEQPGGFVYTAFTLDGKPNGGTYDMTAFWPEGIPPHWGVYFAVGNTDVTAEIAAEHGGTVIGEPIDSPNGRLANLIDNQGAPFTVIQLPN